MTNLALAISIDPEFAGLAKELVFMGGSLNPKTDDPEFGHRPPVRRRTRAAHSSDPGPASGTAVAARSSRDGARDRRAPLLHQPGTSRLRACQADHPPATRAPRAHQLRTDHRRGDLGCPVPHAARPILRAVEDSHEPVLDIPWSDPAHPGKNAAERNIATEEPPADERDFATALGSLLRGRSVRIPCRELSRPVRSRFEALQADGVLDRRYASTGPATWRSTAAFTLTAPPIGALTNE